MTPDLNLTITEQPINLQNLMALQQFSEDGAQVCFIGKVRSQNHGRTVLAVSYDAHPVLTVKSFHQIALQAKKRFGQDLKILIQHRVGKLSVNEPSIVILVSSVHREEAFIASRYIIEEIKHQSPIWKKEFYADGESEWLKGHALCGQNDKTSVSNRTFDVISATNGSGIYP